MSNTSDADERYLSPEEERLLLRIARDTLTSYLSGGRTPSLSDYALTPALLEKHGAFVTLRNGTELRGCVGYIANLEPLAWTVQVNAVNAATHDSRFLPVTAAELPAVTIEISALGSGDTPERPFKRVHDINDVVIGRDGLYIEQPPRRGGILLPQVAIEQGWSVERFLSGVCSKAGYPEGAWKLPGYELYRFSARHFSEQPPPENSTTG